MEVYLLIVSDVVVVGLLVQLVILSRLYVYMNLLMVAVMAMCQKLGCGSQTTPQENGEHSL